MCANYNNTAKATRSLEKSSISWKKHNYLTAFKCLMSWVSGPFKEQIDADSCGGCEPEDTFLLS